MHLLYQIYLILKSLLNKIDGEEKKNSRQKNGSREELKALASRFREVFKTKVVLIGNEEKGKLVIEYYSQDDLYRFEELLEQL